MKKINNFSSERAKSHQSKESSLELQGTQHLTHKISQVHIFHILFILY